ncbi:hypothetical protein N7474_009437 [Penicillium riverlandense]|uniref:uncharacterized protein n=1 Tax=Penicillium riverlandense TaxID=1903569 RepID=UPI002548A7C1|nr:uncharacterized protein N7474_009437 [Penicillium riverlandense]KAJ5808168.1 hypothetical protein N7474_009437 [Penicillium riverlandense]
MSSPTPPQNALSANNLSVLAPIVTDSRVRRSSTSAKDRLSMYSNVSFASQNRSRPGSHVFPIFHSSLPYALVRDFAYPAIHPLHYGPPPQRASGVSTPVSEQRPLSDPPTSLDTPRGQWSWNTEGSHVSQGHQQLPAMSFGDGPPYSEDEDLHSPVVTSRKKEDANGMLVDDHGVAEAPGNGNRGTFISLNPDGSETYYVNDGGAMEDGPGGEYVTYPPREGYFDGYANQQSYAHDPNFESEDEYMGGNRYSTDYQFAVGCPDEEMHGKAVALFDFAREHENELPLTEGQVIYVSYRHGQGWLVAEDPKTGENGLVPEEFVRLLRDIEGGLTSLNEEPTSDSTGIDIDLTPASTESDQARTPTQSIADDSHSTDPGTNGDTPISISIESADHSVNASGSGARDRTSKAAGNAGNRSSMIRT